VAGYPERNAWVSAVLLTRGGGRLFKNDVFHKGFD